MSEPRNFNGLEGARGGAGLKELRSGGESRDRTMGFWYGRGSAPSPSCLRGAGRGSVSYERVGPKGTRALAGRDLGMRANVGGDLEPLGNPVEEELLEPAGLDDEQQAAITSPLLP